MENSYIVRYTINYDFSASKFDNLDEALRFYFIKKNALDILYKYKLAKYIWISFEGIMCSPVEFEAYEEAQNARATS